MIKYILLLIIFFLSINTLYPQSNLSTQISSKVVEVSEQLIIEFEIKNAKVLNYKNPQIQGFKILGPPQISNMSQTSIVNGTFSSSYSTNLTYYMVSNKEGKYKIPPFEFLTDKGVVKSNIIDISVVKAGTNRNNNQSNRINQYDPFGMFDQNDPNDPFARMYGSQQKNSQQKSNSNTPQIYNSTSKINLKEDIFARIILDKQTAYVGEQINASIKIYTAVNSNGFEAEKIPNFNGFWSQEIKLPEKLEMKREIINNKEYVSVEIKKMILFPTTAGELEITPLKMKTVALVPVQIQKQNTRTKQPRDLFELMQMEMEEMMMGNFGSIEYKKIPYEFSSGSKKIKILPLPLPAPKGFSGAVGNYEAKVYINKQAVKTNEAIEQLVEISGNGNLPLILPIENKWNDSFEVFDPQIIESYNSNNIFNGKKTYKYTIIPHYPGKFNSSNIHFTYFDINTKTYKTISTNPTLLDITGKAIPINKNKNLSNEIVWKNQEFKADKNIKKQIFRLTNFVFYFLIFLPLLILIILFLWNKKSSKNENKLISGKQISKNLIVQLEKVGQMQEDNDQKLFLNELINAIYQYLKDKFKIDKNEQNRVSIKQILESLKIDNTNIDNLLKLIDECEFGLYTDIAIDKRVLFAKAQNTLEAIDNDKKEV